jgi:hypothetical protein
MPENRKIISVASKTKEPPIDIFNDTIVIIGDNNKPATDQQIGEFTITADFGEEERIKKEKEKRKAFKKNRQRAYELLAKREFILNKLSSSDLNKKKHINTVAKLNYELEMIDWELNKIREINGYDYIDMHRTTYMQRFLKAIKKKYKKFVKFLSANGDTVKNIIAGVAGVLVPVIIGIVIGDKKTASA